MDEPTNNVDPVLLLSDAKAALSSNKGARLLFAIERQPKPPCVDTGAGKACIHFRQCGSELLACRSFYAYTREPLERKEYKDWLTMEKTPSRKIYEKVYKADQSK